MFCALDAVTRIEAMSVALARASGDDEVRSAQRAFDQALADAANFTGLDSTWGERSSDRSHRTSLSAI